VKTIQRLSENVSRRLVKKHHQATTIKLKLRWADFTTITRQTTISQPTSESSTIANTAEKLFHKAWKSSRAVRLVGVGVSGLAPEQLNLWDYQIRELETYTENQLNSAIKDLQDKFGSSVVRWGNELSEDID